MPVSAKVCERQEGSKRGSVRVNFGGKVRGQQDELNYGGEKCKERQLASRQ